MSNEYFNLFTDYALAILSTKAERRLWPSVL